MIRRKMKMRREMTVADFMDSLNIKNFIEEVKNRPVLWNKGIKEYRIREKKRNEWVDIARIFCHDFDEKDEKERNDICTKLCDRWRHIYDNYKKSIKTKKRYIHARQMSFLDERFGKEDHSQDTSEVADDPDSSSSSQYEQSIKKAKRELESTLLDIIKAPALTQPEAPPPEPPNPDKSFFESVIPSLSGFTEDQKLEFRCEVLRIMQNIRKQNTTNATTASINPQPNYTW